MRGIRPSSEQLHRAELAELYTIASDAISDIIRELEESDYTESVMLDHVRSHAYGARADLMYQLVMAEMDRSVHGNVVAL